MRFLYLISLLLLVGCATQPQIPHNHNANGVKRIAILTPGFDNDLDVRIAVHPGGNFGLIGALVAEGDMSSKSKKFTADVTARGYTFQQKFIDGITQALQAKGYETTFVSVARPEDGLLKQYPASNSEVDAYLDLAAGLTGYVAAGQVLPIAPPFL